MPPNSGVWTLRRNTSAWISERCNTDWGESHDPSSCTIKVAYPFDSGVYWCESERGECSNAINVTCPAILPCYKLYIGHSLFYFHVFFCLSSVSVVLFIKCPLYSFPFILYAFVKMLCLLLSLTRFALEMSAFINSMNIFILISGEV